MDDEMKREKDKSQLSSNTTSGAGLERNRVHREEGKE